MTEKADQDPDQETMDASSAVLLEEPLSGEAEIEDADARVDQAQPTPARKPGRWLAFISFFALLVSVVALCAAGYLYYGLVVQAPLAPLVSRVTGVESQAAEFAGDIQALETRQAEALETFVASQRAELKRAREGMVEALGDMARQAPPSSREWRVAEVAYLLRIANHRVLMERDAQAGLDLLRAADDILLELDDFSFYQVRSELANEMLALERVEGSDLQGIYLRLEAIKRELQKLPLQLPEYVLSRARAAQEDPAPGSFWEAVVAQLSRYFRVRRFDGNIKPMLSPEEAAYLELNLRLMLERAQLAALRREQAPYAGSLTTAADWLTEYLAKDDPVVQRLTVELTDLARIDLNVVLPDISGSLAALRLVRQES